MRKIIDSIIKDILLEIPAEEIHHAKHYDTLCDICRDYPCFVVISSLPTMSPIFVCEKGLEYTGISTATYHRFGKRFFSITLHPDNLSLITSGLSHFSTRPREDFKQAYRIIHAGKEWKWVYGCSRTLNYGADQSADLIISVFCEIEKIFEAEDNAFEKVSIKYLRSRELAKLSLLTSREKEVLRLISDGRTDERIAWELGISRHTAHTHRKSLYRKLGVNNIAEVLKFAFLNQDMYS